MENKKKNKPFLTLFIVMTLSLLLAMTASIPSFYVRLGFQAVILILQLVVIKSIIDQYYGEE